MGGITPETIGFAEPPMDETPIYKHRYCLCCNRQMKPAARIWRHVEYGVRHVHVCVECGEIFIEAENARFHEKVQSGAGLVVRGWRAVKNAWAA